MSPLPGPPAAPLDATQVSEVALVFGLVYLGMMLGGLPRLRLDRTGVALLGAIAVVGLGVLTPDEAARAVHLPTMLLLFSFMVLSAQMRMAGFYDAVTRAIVAARVGTPTLLALVIGVVAALSAVFSNDVVCLAVAPVLARACRERGLPALPFLLALACAANVGSAATLIGNPQAMLIGAVTGLDFFAYAARAALPVLLSLALLWAWLVGVTLRGGLDAPPAPSRAVAPAAASRTDAGADAEPPLDRWQAAKGLGVALVLLVLFVVGDVPRDVAALVGAAVLLLSTRLHSSHVMRLVDWELLVLFAGLFVVNAAFERTGLAAQALRALAAHGVDLNVPALLGLVTVALSNVVSNVPAVMLLLPSLPPGAAGHALAADMALASTFAGNLLLVGSIANLIVADAAQREGVRFDAWTHARVGVPVGLASLAVLVLVRSLSD